MSLLFIFLTQIFLLNWISYCLLVISTQVSHRHLRLITFKIWVLIHFPSSQICFFISLSSKPQLFPLSCSSHMPSSQEASALASPWPSGLGLVSPCPSLVSSCVISPKFLLSAHSQAATIFFIFKFQHWLWMVLPLRSSSYLPLLIERNLIAVTLLHVLAYTFFLIFLHFSFWLIDQYILMFQPN